MESEDFWVDSGRGRMFARRWQPAGPVPARAPLILFHESLGCVAFWRNFPAELACATGRCVIAYDRVGFGRSDPYPGRLAPPGFIDEAVCEDFRALREALGVNRFVAYGHSVGGVIALRTAAHFPDSCLAVISEAAVVFVEARTADGLVQARRSFADQMQFQRLLKYHGDKSRWVLDAWLDTWMSEAMRNWSLADGLREVHCPVLAMQGADDAFSTDEQPRFIVAHAGGPATIRLFDACGHVPHREKKAELLDACSHWLNLQEIP